MRDLFDGGESAAPGYTAHDIEVLEGLEPVRRRPGMYIGGTDEAALDHMVAELLDNAVDEAVSGHATWIELRLAADGSATVSDNGRGIPVDPHPKFPEKSALEVILTTLHSGGKFSDKVYRTSGGLHGVGLSVVNALSESLAVEVARNRTLWRQHYSRGAPLGPPDKQGAVQNRRGTAITFRPDPAIFGAQARFRPERLFRMARSKAYLFGGAEVRWQCDPALLPAGSTTPEAAVLHFPGGLADFLAERLAERPTLTPAPFSGTAILPGEEGRVEWAVAWPEDEEGEVHSYCNTIPTPQGGTHETGLRQGLVRALKGFAELSGHKRAAALTAEDVAGGAVLILSVFLRAPQFQGQTKEKLTSADATRLVEGAIKDHLDHWLSADPAAAGRLLDRIADRAEERQRRRAAKDQARKSPTRKLRLPGKLADCSRAARDGTEIFLVEGDSAGGSAKSARDRERQAILPLRGKILNVASASADKLAGNQEVADLIQALGCGTRASYDGDKLRYERVIIMTDADVDGAHIASLLMTFFFREMRGLLDEGRLFLAQPPLYRLQQGGKTLYARDDAHKAELVRGSFPGKGKIEISRFKGLGEMPPAQLRETTMDPAKRVLRRVVLANGDAAPAGAMADTPGTDGSGDPQATGHGAQADVAALVEQLMGRKPERRLRFIQERAPSVHHLDI
ncbi:MAG: DNA topoisomerase IV subunit B [Alphaproteobacteria bacterium]|jgi:topoisomerase-4 subunit B|nr:DNA topoisomerase IV subunit B [Alphaproteobacteria bacterium]